MYSRSHCANVRGELFVAVISEILISSMANPTHYAQHPAARSATEVRAWMCIYIVYVLHTSVCAQLDFFACNRHHSVWFVSIPLCFSLSLSRHHFRTHYALDLFTDIAKLFIQPIRQRGVRGSGNRERTTVAASSAEHVHFGCA